MSAAAMAWALRAEVTTPEERLLLLLLADFVNSDGICTLDKRWLQKVCCMSQEIMFLALDRLEGNGHIRQLVHGIRLLNPGDE